MQRISRAHAHLFFEDAAVLRSTLPVQLRLHTEHVHALLRKPSKNSTERRFTCRPNKASRDPSSTPTLPAQSPPGTVSPAPFILTNSLKRSSSSINSVILKKLTSHGTTNSRNTITMTVAHPQRLAIIPHTPHSRDTHKPLDTSPTYIARG